MELRWDQLDTSDSPLSGFAVTYAPLGRGPRRSDFLERQHSSYLLQGLEPGLLYNISTFSVRRGANSNDISQPAFALIRTRKEEGGLVQCFWPGFVCLLSTQREDTQSLEDLTVMEESTHPAPDSVSV